MMATTLSHAAPTGENNSGGFINGIVTAVFGGGYEAPPYTVVQTFEVGSNTFEERNYEGGKKWACTKKVVTEEDGSNGMFMKLFRYIGGANSAGAKIDMTVPVSTLRKDLGSGQSEYEMCFYLNGAYQNSPPQPTEEGVYLVTRPEMNIYTRRLGGYMGDEDWNNELTAMNEMLSSQGLSSDPSQYYVNGYNSPMQFWNRRNELWKIKA